VAVVKVTGPSKPDAAVKVLENEALLSVVVKPLFGGPWTTVSGVTVNEKLQVPVSP
jgi:hypothetical protein